MADEQKAVLMGLIAGLLAGILSKSVGAAAGVIVAVVVGYALNTLQQKIFREKKQGWASGNLIMPYIFTWVITWIFLVNV